MGVDFDIDRKRNMYVFFFKKLQRMLRKMKKKREAAEVADGKKKGKKKKKKKKKIHPIKVTANPDANREWRERLAMWDDDTWLFKHAVLHEQKAFSDQ